MSKLIRLFVSVEKRVARVQQSCCSLVRHCTSVTWCATVRRMIVVHTRSCRYQVSPCAGARLKMHALAYNTPIRFRSRELITASSEFISHEITFLLNSERQQYVLSHIIYTHKTFKFSSVQSFHLILDKSAKKTGVSPKINNLQPRKPIL